MKKLITLILSIIMTISVSAPMAFAEDETERVLAIVKSRIDDTEKYDEFSSSYSENNGITLYRFNWSNKENGDSMSISCRDNGEISNFRLYNYKNNQSSASISTVGKNEAWEIARQFTAKINPDIKDELVIDKNGISQLRSGYIFNVKRVKNGMDVLYQTGSITLNNDNTEVESFYMNLSGDVSKAGDKEFISPEQAESLYKKNMPIELVYYSYMTKDKKTVMYPIYERRDNGKYIDAQTGEVVDTSENSRAKTEPAAENAVTSAGGASADKGIQFSDAELGNLDEIKGLISKADIEKQMRENTYLNINNKKLEYIQLYKSYSDKYSYHMRFDTGINIYADAKTGEIISYYNFTDSGKEEQSDKDADNKYAEEIAKSFAGEKIGEYRLDSDDKSRGVTYSRYVNDIRVAYDRININVINGVLQSYNINYTKAEFPSLENILSPNEAMDKLFENTEYKVSIYANDRDIKYVYAFNESFSVINPYTGEITDYKYGEDTEDEKIDEYTDIDNYYARDIINTLKEYGIGFSGGKFKPNETITQAEFAYLLSRAFYGYAVPINNIYGFERINDIIYPDEQDADKTLDRETAAVYMIRAIGAEEYANIEGIYVKPFDDIEDYIGYIAILKGLGVIKGDENGNFNPKNTMTRGEAAVIMYNYLIKK